MQPRRLATALFMLLVSLLSLPAWADDLIESRAYWRDDSARADFETAQRQTYREYQGLFSGGYTTAVHWFRFRIAPSASESILLRIRPHYLDSISLYDPAQRAPDGSIQPRYVGDEHPISGGGFPSINHVFRLPGAAEPRDVWVRLATTSTHMMHAQAFDLAEGLRSESRWLGFFSVAFGLIVLTLLWALSNVIGRRDRVVLWFALKQSVLAINFSLYTGLFRLIGGDAITPAAVSYLTSLFVIASVVLGTMYELIFLREFKPPRILQWAGWLLWIPSLLGLGWFLAGHETAALQLNALFLLIIPPLCAVLSWFGRVWKEPVSDESAVLPRHWLLGYYLVLIGTLGLGILPALGVTEMGEWGLIGPLVYALISGALMIGLLQMRFNLLLRFQRQRAERLRASEALARAERARREEQSRFMDMLTHELKTPLAVVRMAVGSSQAITLPMMAEAQRAIDDMRAVIDRCAQTEKAEEGGWTLQVQPTAVEETLLELSQRAPRGAITVRSTKPAGQVQTDPTILNTILGNLIDNALKYRAVDSTIFVELEGDEQGVRVTVCNTPGAAGWPDATRVFGKYYRSPGAHRETGSGLGLYLVSQLARLVGGSVHYRPTETQVRFELWIPRSISS